MIFFFPISQCAVDGAYNFLMMLIRLASVLSSKMKLLLTGQSYCHFSQAASNWRNATILYMHLFSCLTFRIFFSRLLFNKYSHCLLNIWKFTIVHFQAKIDISDKHHVLVGCCYLRDFFIDKNLSDSLSGSPCEFAEYTTAEWCCWWLVLISSLCDNIIMCNSTEAHWMICSSSEWNGFPSIKSGEWFACKQYLFHSLKLLDLQCSRK